MIRRVTRFGRAKAVPFDVRRIRENTSTCNRWEPRPARDATAGLMRMIEIPKRGGGSRTIYVPNGTDRRRMARFADHLAVVQEYMCIDCVHGFRKDRSVITNAAQHIGYRWTLCMDIANWYDSITITQVHDAIDLYLTFCVLSGDGLGTHINIKSIVDRVCVDGAPRQGLPTSPFVANIVTSQLDLEIINLCRNGVTYTRYADDMIFSSDEYAQLLMLREAVPCLVSGMGWSVNAKKTRLMDARFGRRTICGVSVGEHDLKITRRWRRKMRAVMHKGYPSKVAGCRAWVKSVERPERRM